MYNGSKSESIRISAQKGRYWETRVVAMHYRIENKPDTIGDVPSWSNQKPYYFIPPGPATPENGTNLLKWLEKFQSEKPHVPNNMLPQYLGRYGGGFVRNEA